LQLQQAGSNREGTILAALHIAPVPLVADEDLRPLFAAMVRIDRANNQAIFGHVDLCAGSAEAAQLDYLNQDDFRCQHLLAMAGARHDADADAVVGYGSIWRPTKDNLHTALVGVCVDPRARSRGVGSALLSAVEDIATNDRRSVINTWSIHAPASGEGPARAGYAAAHGPGVLSPDDPAAVFFLRRGYVLDQTHSTFQLDLPDGWDPEDRSDEAGSTPYELVGWEGGTPEGYVTSMAGLRTMMSTAAPAGSIEPEEQRWDAERVHRHDRERSGLGLALHTIAALHRGTGEPAGYTELTVSPRTPGLAMQGDTFVAPGHRGHGLGRAIKIANLTQARRAHPLLRRVVTTNAGENAAMRSVNLGLGFREVGVDGNWQKVIGGRCPPSECGGY
jgi:GNAT superfamily N-acetyltransferase